MKLTPIRTQQASLRTSSRQTRTHILFIACHDFIRVAKGQPVELQVYEAWWFATAYANVSEAPLQEVRK